MLRHQPHPPTPGLLTAPSILPLCLVHCQSPQTRREALCCRVPTCRAVPGMRLGPATRCGRERGDQRLARWAHPRGPASGQRGQQPLRFCEPSAPLDCTSRKRDVVCPVHLSPPKYGKGLLRKGWGTLCTVHAHMFPSCTHLTAPPSRYKQVVRPPRPCLLCSQATDVD